MAKINGEPYIDQIICFRVLPFYWWINISVAIALPTVSQLPHSITQNRLNDTLQSFLPVILLSLVTNRGGIKVATSRHTFRERRITIKHEVESCNAPLSPCCLRTPAGLINENKVPSHLLIHDAIIFV